MTKRSDFDIAIVGGGPAGLASAIGFAKQGFSVVVLEKNSWPQDKACGEGIMPTGVSELARLGVLPLIHRLGAHSFDGIEMISMNERHAQADFAEGSGLGVRRTTLSSALYECARDLSSVTLRANTRVKNIQRHPTVVVAHTDDVAINSRFLVAADGLRSTIRSRLNAQVSSSAPRRYGANQHYQIKPWNPSVEVHFSNGLEAYVTPCTSESIGIAFLWNYDRFSPQLGRRFLVDECVERFPSLSQRLQGTAKMGPLQTTGPLLQEVSSTVHDNIVLLGDAGGYFDAITGEGISLALREARLLVDATTPLLQRDKAIASEDLQSFAQTQKQLRRSMHVTTQLSLWTARYPWLQLPVFALLKTQPRLFQRFLSMNMGNLS